MADTIFTRALNAAVEIEGSTQGLASLLRVPEGTLLRWIAGRAMMPVRAFVRLMDIVATHEARLPDEPSEPAPAEAVLTFHVHQLRARCASCDAVEFVRRSPGAALRYRSVLACNSCGQEIVHCALLIELVMLSARENGDTRARRSPGRPALQPALRRTTSGP
ncbi:MAG TPA: hypothetical protein VM183_13635 [Burkholderiales bacterium]|nr:hypothetical protein [Burkholderiales bacterium]